MAKPTTPMRRYLRFSTVGLELGLAVIIGLLVGQWLDARLGTEPWLLLLFLLFGMVAGFRSVYRLARDFNAPDRDPRDGGSNGNGGAGPGDVPR
jgi:F0F1-type ATP synthase assembly protein I